MQTGTRFTYPGGVDLVERPGRESNLSITSATPSHCTTNTAYSDRITTSLIIIITDTFIRRNANNEKNKTKKNTNTKHA